MARNRDWVVSSSAALLLAIVAVIHCSHAANLETFDRYLLPVAVYGNEDRRRTEVEWAAQVHEPLERIRKRFAATGVLDCGELSGTAQLTLSNDIITTAAHMLENKTTCVVTARPNQCVFTLDSGPTKQSIRVKELVARGFNCRKKEANQTIDWAVMKLERPVHNVTPYRIDGAKVASLQNGMPILLVAYSFDFAKPDGSRRDKHIGNCSLMKVYHREGGMPYFLTTDCDSTKGASGGSVLAANEDNPILLAIDEGGYETEEEYEKGLRLGIRIKKPYQEGVWMAKMVPVVGPFLDAIRKGAGLKPEPQVPPVRQTVPPVQTVLKCKEWGCVYVPLPTSPHK